MSPKDRRKVDDFILYGICAADQAVRDAGWAPDKEEDLLKTGVMIGSGIGGLQSIGDTANLIKEKGAVLIETYKEWFSEGQKILNDENRCNSLRDNAFDFIARRGGSSEKYADIILND